MLFVLHLFCISFHPPFVKDWIKNKTAVYCCVWSKNGCPWPRIGSGRKYECCELLYLPPPSPPSTQLIVTSPDRYTAHRSFIKSIRTGRGPIVSSVPPPDRTSLEAAPTHHRLIFVLPLRLFCQPQRKIDRLEGSGGERRHQRWCWMALVAIVRWFGGHRTWFRFDRWSVMIAFGVCALCVDGRESLLRDGDCKNHVRWYLVLRLALTVKVGSSWMDTTRTLAIQYRISELCIFKVRYCEMLRSELSVHRNSHDPRLDAVEFFVADTGFCWVGTLSGASGSCVRPFF